MQKHVEHSVVCFANWMFLPVHRQPPAKCTTLSDQTFIRYQQSLLTLFMDHSKNTLLCDGRAYLVAVGIQTQPTCWKSKLYREILRINWKCRLKAAQNSLFRTWTNWATLSWWSYRYYSIGTYWTTAMMSGQPTNLWIFWIGCSSLDWNCSCNARTLGSPFALVLISLAVEIAPTSCNNYTSRS